MKRYKVTHIMNKKQLIIILVAGLFCGTANAVVDLNAPGTLAMPVGTVMIANENTINGRAGTDVSGDAYNVTGEAGFIIPGGETYYARIDLGGGATFGAAVASNFSGLETPGRASGGMGESDVILSLPGATDGTADDAPWNLQGMTYKLKSKGTVSFMYRLYETASAAVAGGNNALSTQSANLITFANATSMAGAASAPSEIDVASSSVKYENKTSTSHIMKINIKNAVGIQVPVGSTDGTDDVMMDMVVDKITLTATGDFTAVAAPAKGKPAGKVWLDKDEKCTPDIPAVPADADAGTDAVPVIRGGHNLGLAKINDAGLEAVVTLTNAANDTDDQGDPTGVFGDIKDAYLCMMTNGVSEIPEGSYKGKLSMTAADTYVAIADVNFKGSTLVRNSDSADLNFLLTPEGTFRNYVRLTNTSSVQGSNLMVTLINDAGDKVTFPLSDVKGLSDELAPRASTKLININDLYAAAQALKLAEGEKMFTVMGEGMSDKLRAEFEGSILSGNLKAQALSVSTDNTSFFTF